MKDIISYKTRRILTLLEATNTQGTLKISDLQKINSCSNKTVYDDIYYISGQWGQLIGLTFDTSNVQVKHHGVRDLMFIKEQLYDLEPSILLLLHLFEHPYTSMTEISKTTSFSESNIRNHFKTINKFLVQYGAHITTNSAYLYYLKAEDEMAFDHLIFKLLSLTNQLSILPPLKKEELPLINQYIKEHVKVSHKISTDHIKNTLQVATLRESQGFGNVDDAINETISRIGYLNDKFINAIEIIGLDKLAQNINERIGALPSLDAMHKGVEIIRATLIETCLFPHKIDNFFNRYEIFYKHIKRTHINIVDLFESCLSQLESITNISVLEFKEEIFYEIYTYVEHMRSVIPYRIAVYSDMGAKHTENHIHFLKLHLALHEFFPYDEDVPFDILVTTTISKFIDKVPVKKIVAVSDFLSETDIHNVLYAIYYSGEYL